MWAPWLFGTPLHGRGRVVLSRACLKLSPPNPSHLSLSPCLFCLPSLPTFSGKKDLNRLYNLMMSYDFAGNEWKRFEFWDSKKKYTRNLIANVPGCLCLMLLCWNPEKGSPIHNHAGSEWLVRQHRRAIGWAGRATTPIARM
jgi:hypothetical protein